MISKENLDKRICDIEKGSANTETYREFIVCAEKDIGVESFPLDRMTDEQLAEHLDILDYLLTK